MFCLSVKVNRLGGKKKSKSISQSSEKFLVQKCIH